jgi:hypothetical protein
MCKRIEKDECPCFCSLPKIQYVSPRPPKEDSELHRLARAGDQAAILNYLTTHGTDNIDELNAGMVVALNFVV